MMNEFKRYNVVKKENGQIVGRATDGDEIELEPDNPLLKSLDNFACPMPDGEMSHNYSRALTDEEVKMLSGDPYNLRLFL
jgi:hypothetical protein